MVAATYYVSLGLQVYWPHIRQGPYDFVVDKPNGLWRVQVKTACWVGSGKFKYLQCRTRATNPEQYGPNAKDDVLFVVVFGDEIWEIPAKLIDSSNLSLRGTNPDYGGTRWDGLKVQ